MRKLIIAAAVISAVAALMPAPAGATFPASNGRIAFKRYLDPFRSTAAIFAGGADGKRQHQLTHPATGVVDDQPDWSPDGSKITFERCRVSGACEVWTVGADGTGEARVGPDCLGALPPSCESRSAPAYSPGAAIAFGHGSGDAKGEASQHADLDVMNADASGLRTIWSAPPYSVNGGSVAWAPNGKRLVLSLENSKSATPPGGFAVYVINADGSGMRRITPFGMRAGDHPDWSPDGKRILFRSHADSIDAVGSQIYTVRPDGTGLKRLSHFKHGRAVLSSSYSPDGKWITVALDGVGGNPDVYVMRTNGTGLRPVTRTSLWDSAPDWGPAR
jgi:TolB protein